MKKKNGFTLIEIIIALVIISVIAVVIGFSINSLVKKTKEREYLRYLDMVKSSTSTYLSLNREVIEDLYTNKSFIFITPEDLIKEGLLDENIKNPYTGENLSETDSLIGVTIDGITGGIIIKFPYDPNHNSGDSGNPDDPNDPFNINGEITLRAFADVLDDEGIFNCMNGAGSYKLALAKEDGTLVHLADASGNLDGTLISQYDINCKIPKEFTETTGSKDALVLGSVYRTFKNYNVVEGTYNIEYSWRDKNGQIHKINRLVSVKGKKMDVKFGHNKKSDTGTLSTDHIVVINGAPYGTLATATRTNHIFGGWYYENNLILNNTTVTATESHTLLAKWMKKPTITSQGYNKSGATMSASNGYVYKDVATITYYGPEDSNDTINYYLRSGSSAVLNVSAYACGTGSIPGTCGSSGVTTISANTWYKVGSGTTNTNSTVTVTYQNHNDVNVTLETYVINAKNYNGPGNSIQIKKIDRTNPATCQVNPNGTLGNNGYYVSNMTFTATGTDVASGVASQTVNISSITSDTTGTTITATIVDYAGNSTTCSNTYKMDKTPPGCASSGGNTWTSGNVTITGTCSDSNSGCVGNVSKLYTTEGLWNNQSPGVVYDNAGNSTTCPANQAVKIDRTKPTKPTVSYIGGANTCSWKNDYKLTVSSSDAGGVYKFQVDHDNNGTVDAEYIQSSNSWTWTPSNEYDTHNDRYRVVDYAGNISDWSDPQHIHMTSCTFTITYNANGGSGAPTPETHVCKNSYNLSIITPTNSGKEFVGWSTDSSASTATYAAGASYSGGSVTLYAVWKSSYTCPSSEDRLVYDASYGASSGGYICVRNVIVGSSYSCVDWQECCETCGGWYAGQKCDSFTYSDYHCEDFDCSILINPGGSELSYCTGNQLCTRSKRYICEPYYNCCTRSESYPTYDCPYGYNTYQGSGSSMTCYRNAIVPKTITINYNANGGSGAPESGSQTCTTDDRFTISTQKPTRDGYRFIGWSTSSTGTSIEYAAGSTYTYTTGTLNLYAVWGSPKERFTVVYSCSGGISASDAYCSGACGTTMYDRTILYSYMSFSSSDCEQHCPSSCTYVENYISESVSVYNDSSKSFGDPDKFNTSGVGSYVGCAYGCVSRSFYACEYEIESTSYTPWTRYHGC